MYHYPMSMCLFVNMLQETIYKGIRVKKSLLTLIPCDDATV